MNTPLIKLEELQQGKVLVDELGLLTEMPDEIIQLSQRVKQIMGASKVVQGMCAGDYFSLVSYSAIYWGIVKTFPRTVIRNVKKFLNRFSEQNSSRNLLLVFNYTGKEREKILASLQHGISGIAKDYGFEEGSHLDYWKKLMTAVGIMADSHTGKLSPEGAKLLAQLEKAEPIMAMDTLINKETDMRNALIGMLAVEFIAVGISECVIDSPESQILFAPNGRGITREWFDVHYHSGDHHLLENGEYDLTPDFDQLKLPHDTINYNMLKMAHTADYADESLQDILEAKVLHVAEAFAAAGNYTWKFDESINLNLAMKA
ncbi:hypothetical protein ACX27_11780 [Nostoc piscinale CENA21]|uniref:Uncharacterized protein n=1 Tax=Nostoc piscinale CENA21 TaxID=224013 RepID=A0A0M3V5B2_9NOSO|nr:hypothetical protein [Nostoc piscinale]ALF53367.1 hypothetical protein ACX27_11780 [Nostoc piscinale CENA21]